MKLREAINQFTEWKSYQSADSTVRGYTQDLKMLSIMLRYQGVLEIEDLRLPHVMRCLKDMLEDGWTNASLMRKCMALRKFLEFMRMVGVNTLDKELIPVPKPEYKMPRVASEENYRKLLAVVPKNNDPRHIRNRAIIMLLWDTGLRIGELTSLNVGDVDTGLKRGTVRTEKNRGSRTHRPFFWTAATNKSLVHWIAKRGDKSDPALFISCSSWKVGQRMDTSGIGEALRSYSNKAGLPYMNPHSFRHHLGHEIIHKGGSSADVANILGHASLLSTLKYTQMSDPEVESRYRRLRG
jgi:integrase/recombinase XerC